MHSTLCLVLALHVTQPADNLMRVSPTDEASLELWSFSNGPEFPGAAGTLGLGPDETLALSFDFTGGGAYVAAYRALDPPVSVSGFAFRVLKPNEALIGVRFTDSTGQTFQKTLSYDYDGWLTVEGDMAGWSVYWGGANDGVLHQPVRSMGVLVDQQGIVERTGVVLFDDLDLRIGTTEPLSTLYRGEYVVTDFGPGAGFGTDPRSSLEGGLWRCDLSQAESAWLSHSLSLFGRPRELALRVRSGPPGSVLRMRVGSHFQVFERTIGVLDGAEQVFSFAAPPDGWQYWGGQNDGAARLPLRVINLILERGSAAPGPTVVELGELRCVTELRRDDAIVLLPRIMERGVTDELRQLTVVCEAWNLLDEPLDGLLSAEITDWSARTLREIEVPLRLPAQGERTEVALEVEVPASRSFVEVALGFVGGGLQSARATATYTRPLDGPGSAELVPESPWGMGVYLYRYPHTPEGLALMDRAAALAGAAGVKWSREEFSWSSIEPRRGEFDFSFYDAVVDTARRHGISVYGLLAYWSPWTQAYTEEGIEDFCRWARAVVEHFRDRVKHWEVYNEPNIFFWSGPRDLYPVLLERCYHAIKETDPEAVVLGISTAGIDMGFISKCVEAGAPFDILTVHPYRARLQEQSFVRELRDAMDLVGGRPVWITEMGWSTEVRATAERTQAELLARCYLAAVASGACSNVSWYNFRCDGTDPFYNEANFGVLRHDLTPKPAYRALATVCRTLEGGALRPVAGLPNGLWGVESDSALALWAAGQSFSVPCVVTEGQPVVSDLMGDVLMALGAGEQFELDLRAGSPVFVTRGKVAVTGEPSTIERQAVPGVVRF